jgi:hypothetical protein
MTFMQRVRAVQARQDCGAVVVLVTILLAGGVLLGMTAMVIDVGSLYGERRQLQNSADAGALSLAQDCAVGQACTPDPGNVSGIVNSNDPSDGVSNVAGVCVHIGGVSSGVCSSASAQLADCLPPPAGIDDYVEVRTSTVTDKGSTLLPPFIAQAVVDGYSGTTVGACSRVAWGSPGGLSTIPITISNCEFNYYVGPARKYAPPPPYPPTAGATWPDPSFEHVITLHNTQGNVAPCAPGPAGSDAPISGGFGWLESADCVVSTDVAEWFDASPGNSPGSDCRAEDFDDAYGQLIDLPIYDGTNGLNGANGKYHVLGYAAFVLTGFNLHGQYKEKSLITGTLPCSGSSWCISGFFTQDLSPTSADFGGPPMGVTSFRLAG